VIVTASVDASLNGATPVTFSSRLPLQLSAFALSLSGPDPSPSARGPVVSATSPFGPVTPAVLNRSANPLRQARLGLLAALLLGVGAAIIFWPTFPAPMRSDLSSLQNAVA
jgi:hypothetical protein